MRRRTLCLARNAAIPALALFAAACANRTAPVAPQAAGPGVAPALVVERFLNAVNARDYETMARLFGTKSGSVLLRDPRPEVERRMFALASVLRHDDYGLDGERVAPGRGGEAVQITVTLRLGDRRVPVPFVIVRTRDSSWLIEQVDVEAITASR